MRVHDADLAAEERAALGTLKIVLRTAAVGERPVEQARAIGGKQMLLDDRECAAACRGVSMSLMIAWIIGRRL